MATSTGTIYVLTIWPLSDLQAGFNMQGPPMEPCVEYTFTQQTVLQNRLDIQLPPGGFSFNRPGDEKELYINISKWLSSRRLELCASRVVRVSQNGSPIHLHFPEFFNRQQPTGDPRVGN